MCHKEKFDDREAADRALASIHRRGRRGHKRQGGVRPYRCPECGAYHLTNQKSIKGLKWKNKQNHATAN